jgi:hypothetical protein
MLLANIVEQKVKFIINNSISLDKNYFLSSLEAMDGMISSLLEGGN